jgi:hypothetical protein
MDEGIAAGEDPGALGETAPREGEGVAGAVSVPVHDVRGRVAGLADGLVRRLRAAGAIVVGRANQPGSRSRGSDEHALRDRPTRGVRPVARRVERRLGRPLAAGMAAIARHTADGGGSIGSRRRCISLQGNRRTA